MPNNFGGSQHDPDYKPPIIGPGKRRKRPRTERQRPPIAVAGSKSVATRIQIIIEQLETIRVIVDTRPTRMKGRRLDLRTISRNRLSEMLGHARGDLATMLDIAKRL